MTKKTTNYQSFISKPEISFWVPILIALLGIAVTWGAWGIRIEAVEKKLATYPSQDYFELKFKTIDNSIQEVKDVLDEHIKK